MFSPNEALTQNPSVLVPFLALIIAGIVVIAVKRVCALFSGRKRSGLQTVTAVVRRPILTANETAFFRTLQHAVGTRYLIFPQLSLQCILEGHASNASAQVSFTNQIDRKRVDFVLVDPQDLRVHLAIEVDDRSHEADHRRRRDGLVASVLRQAGITLVRIPAAREYAVSTLRKQLGLLDGQIVDEKVGPAA